MTLDISVFIGKFVEEARDRSEGAECGALAPRADPGSDGGDCRGDARCPHHQGLRADARVHRHLANRAQTGRPLRRGQENSRRSWMATPSTWYSRPSIRCRRASSSSPVARWTPSRSARSARRWQPWWQAKKGVGCMFPRQTKKAPDPSLRYGGQTPGTRNCGSRCGCPSRSSSGWRTWRRKWSSRASRRSSATPSCGASSGC